MGEDPQKDRATETAIKDKLSDAGITLIEKDPRDGSNYAIFNIGIKVDRKKTKYGYDCRASYGVFQVNKNAPLPGGDAFFGSSLRKIEDTYPIAHEYADNFISTFKKARELLVADNIK